MAVRMRGSQNFTSTFFALLVLPTFYLQVHEWLERRRPLLESHDI
jgi:hypothetical protein